MEMQAVAGRSHRRRAAILGVQDARRCARWFVTSPSPTMRERIAEERRQEILEAAYRLFVRRGLEGATMQDIAAEVGLTAGALYRYYGNKDSLTEAVFAWCAEQRFTAFDAAEQAASPF